MKLFARFFAPPPPPPAPVRQPVSPAALSPFQGSASSFTQSVDYSRLGAQPVGNPLATNVKDAFPTLNLTPQSSDADLRTMIRQDIQTAYGREATQTDYDYWLPKLRSDCDSSYVTSGKMTSMDYWHNRMLGWQAGGADVATAGPYAGMDFGGGGSDASSGFGLIEATDPITAQLKEMQRQKDEQR